MKRIVLVVLVALTGLIFARDAGWTASAALQSIVDGAKKEGSLKLYASSTLGPEGVRQLQAGMNKRYGLNLAVQYTPSGSMTRDVAKVVTELSTGASPTWDMMLVTDAHYATLFTNGLLEKFDWVGTFGVDPKAIFYDGTAVAYATQFVAPAYNKQLVKAAEAPKKWEDLLDAKWQGKIGVTTAHHHWARLGQLWGDEKTSKYLQALASQKLVRGRIPETYTRLLLGEILVAATLTDSYIDEAREKGAPVAFADSVDPVIGTQYLAAPLKGARSKNAALLFAAHLLTNEGQAAWFKNQGQSSMFVKGSQAYDFAQKRNVTLLEYKFATTRFEELENKYGKLLGFK